MVEDKKADQKEVDWLKYYTKIRQVCPWSYRSYTMGSISTIPYNEMTFHTYANAFKVTKSKDGVLADCFVYVCEGKSPQWLEAKVKELQSVDKYSASEWLYSTPDDDDEGNATPVPVIIQQRKAQLEELRQKTGYYND
tara:strand:+ start:1292 stop:1705 length:414 start_codon:yes stop_codon:yes gene_type:complete